MRGGGFEKFLTPEREALKKLGGGGLRKFVYFKTNRRGDPKKIEPLARGAAKISKLPFSISSTPPPPCHIT